MFPIGLVTRCYIYIYIYIVCANAMELLHSCSKPSKYSMPLRSSGLLFTKRLDVLPTNLVKSRSRENGCYNDRIVLKLDRHLDIVAARCLSNFRTIRKVETRISLLRNFTRSCGKTSYPLVNRSLGYRPGNELTKDTPYLDLMRELWGVLCEYFGEKYR